MLYLIRNGRSRSNAYLSYGVEWSGVEWSGVEWNGMAIETTPT